MATYTAPEGYVAKFPDAMGQEETVKFGKTGKVETDNPLWVEHLDTLVAAGVLKKKE